MVSVNAPKDLSGSVSGAFVFDEAALKRMCAYASSLYGKGVSFKFILKVKDGTEYSVDKIEDIDELPLHDRSRRESFSFRANSDDVWKSLYLSASYTCPSRVFFLVSDRGGPGAAFEHFKGEIFSQKIWYSWIYSYLWWAVGAVMLNAGPLIMVSALPTQSAILYNYGSVITVAAVILVLSAIFLRRFLFESLVVSFGHEVCRQDRLRSARRWVFGTLGGGVLLAAVAAVFRILIP